MQALESLIKNKQPISLDSVALEAGRPRGSIRRNQKRFKQLIAEIDLAEKAFKSNKQENRTSLLEKERERTKMYKSMYENVLKLNLSYLLQIQELKDDIYDLETKLEQKRAKEKVVSISKEK